MSKARRYRLEFAAVWLWLGLCRALPLDAASALTGAALRLLGPRMRSHRTALANLAMVFPKKTDAERKKIARGMWENLGRNIGEFAHLPGKALTARNDVEGLEHLPQNGEQVLFASGHLGNWELTYPVAFGHGIPVTLVYRHANNPRVDRLVGRIRAHHATDMLPKGPKGAIRLLRSLKKKQSIAMLVDQKMNEGIAVPFFGRPAMTAPAIAELSLRYGIPIIPARVIRLKGAHFRGIVYPPLDIPKTGDEQKDVYAIMEALNALIEGWIREYPEQWLWTHKRWPKESR